MRERILRWAVRLYPRAWRERYGDEFVAMVEQMPRRGWDVVWDTAKGAMAMQVKRNGKLATMGIFGVAGLLMAGAGSLAIRDRYISQSAVEVPKSIGVQALHAALDRVLNHDRLERLLNKHSLYDGRTDAGRELKKHVGVSGLTRLRNGSAAFRVGFQYADPVVAQRVTTEITDDIVKEMPGLTVLDGASLPSQPLWPNRKVIGFMGLAGGSLFGAIVALVRGRRGRIAR